MDSRLLSLFEYYITRVGGVRGLWAGCLDRLLAGCRSSFQSLKHVGDLPARSAMLYPATNG